MSRIMEKPADQISIRDTLFGDLPLKYWAGINSGLEPWIKFRKAKQYLEMDNKKTAAEIFHEILATPGLESRHYLQAMHFLSQLGETSNAEIELFGVVAEVSMDEGCDLLAVYKDHSARYYNYSGSASVWDTPDEQIGSKVDHILDLGMTIVAQIGPWKGERPAPPKTGFARINFLTSEGLHFGEADQAVLFKDPMAGKIMYAMLDMMETLINKTNPPK